MSDERMVRYVRGEVPAPSKADTERFRAVSKLPDSDVDFSDAPALGPEAWSRAERGRFFRPVKQQLTMRLDASVVDWFRRNARNGKGYQTDINRALREYIAQRERKPAGKKKAG